jgi:acetylornithine deacetylase
MAGIMPAWAAVDTVGLLSRLVAIDSVNPSLVPGGAGEEEIARFVTAWSRAAGLTADVLRGTPGRASVIVRAPGSGGGRTLALCAHLDTVGVGGMRAPHTPRVAGDRLYGRGAYDMKAGLAAALAACAEASTLGLAGDVVVAAVADEEHASLGVQEALGVLRADAAIVPEPTDGALIVAHKGFVWSEVTVNGRAAHGSRPQLGVHAIAPTGPVLTRLARLDAALARTEHPLLGGARIAGAGYWTDAAFLAAAGIPTVLYGPGGEGAHADEEWVSLSDAEAVKDTLVAAAARLCA